MTDATGDILVMLASALAVAGVAYWLNSILLVGRKKREIRRARHRVRYGRYM